MKNKTPNFLLLRGLFRNNHHWGEFPKLLQEKYPDSKIICIELPGNGEKYQQTSPLRISEYVDLMRSEWLQKGGVPNNNWQVIAISLGAMVAMEWDSTHKDFEKMFLLNTSSSDVANPLKRLSLPAAGLITKLFLSNDTEVQEKSILNLTTRMTNINDDLIQKWKDLAIKWPTTRKNALRQLFAASKFKSPVKLNTKTLFLAATHDQLANISCSTKLSHKYNAKLFTHPEAGHDLPLDDPEWIIDVIDKENQTLTES